jgi:DNA-directed RNA polymerase specialized sigma24 family protein
LSQEDYDIQAEIIELFSSDRSDRAVLLIYKYYQADLERELKRGGFFRSIYNDADRQSAINDAIVIACNKILSPEEEISFLFTFIKDRARESLLNQNRFWKRVLTPLVSTDDESKDIEKFLRDLTQYKGTSNSSTFAELKEFRMLDQDCQDRISYFFEDGYSHREIAKMMESSNSESHARKQHSRCIQKLRKFMKK